MDFCSVCGQGFVNEEDFYYHECFVFKKKSNAYFHISACKG